MTPQQRAKIPLGPKIVVGLTSAITLGAVFYSHYSQVQDKATMRAGVERDKERMRMKRRMKKRLAREEATKQQQQQDD
jgi:hypothetical protein